MSKDLLDLFGSLDEDDAEADRQKEIDSGGREKYLRAPFGRVGGKFKELPKILPHLPYGKSYIEPFCGSASILLARKPSPLEVINDRHGGIVAFYRCVRDKEKCEKLIDRLEWCRQSREEFIWCKETWENCEDDVERAARWFYCVSFSFANMGLAFGRVTKSTGIISTRMHGHLKDFIKIHERLAKVQIENLDYKTCLLDYDHTNAVFLVDPPYLNFSGNAYGFDFTEKDHVEMLKIIFDMKGFVGLCGYPNDLYDKYDWDHIYAWDRHVSLRPNGVIHDKEEDQRETHKECLWIKNERS
jgi:DNA adenine methylase